VMGNALRCSDSDDTSREIDKLLNRDKKRLRRELKLLLLGETIMNGYLIVPTCSSAWIAQYDVCMKCFNNGSSQYFIVFLDYLN